MAEVVGLASGLLALTIFAYGTSKSLYEAVSSFKSQRKTIKDVEDDLRSLVTVLGSIREQAQCAQEVEILEPLRQPLNCCATICGEMREMLDACTTHSKEGRDSVRDWLKMQYHGKSFEDVKQRLASYKSTLSIAFESINIQVHSITQDSLNDLKNSIRGTKEDLEDQLDQVRQAISTADASLREMLQVDQARLQTSLDSLARAQRVADTTDPKVVLERNRAGQGSRAIFGTDTSQPQFSLTVSDNEAELGAVMAAGVHSPETLQALLRDSRTPDLALTLQALQTQSQRTNTTTLQSILNSLSAERKKGFIDPPLEASLRPSSRASEHADTSGIVPLPERSIGSIHEDASKCDEVLERRFK